MPHGTERQRRAERHTDVSHSTSQGQGRACAWELLIRKDMMMQYSPSARVSWMATDWSMLSHAADTHPGGGQMGAPFGQ